MLTSEQRVLICVGQVEEIRESVQGIDMREILDACLQNRGWVNGVSVTSNSKECHLIV